MKGGVPPFHTFPPDTLASNPPGLPPLFFGRESARGKGTPTSGRHRCAKRSERRIALFFHDTPARERRPLVGTAARRAARWRIALFFHDTPVRERRPPVGTAARSAASGGSLFSFTPRRPGNADLRSAPLREAQRAADRSSLSRHAGQGTPTSGRHRCASRSERRPAELFHGTRAREGRAPGGIASRREAKCETPISEIARIRTAGAFTMRSEPERPAALRLMEPNGSHLCRVGRASRRRRQSAPRGKPKPGTRRPPTSS